jgi:hypothetical protein
MPGSGDIWVWVGPQRRKQRIEVCLDDAHLLPAKANLRQQLRPIAADLFRSTPGIGDLVEQLLNPRLGGDG